MPHVERSNVVGLFGGSFNPPHAGHLLVAKIAIRRLRLDQLWWMVTPKNPLKDCTNLLSLEERMGLSVELIDHPKIRVTGFEQAIGSKVSVDTVSHILAHYRGVRFVWVIGADSFASIHHWYRWHDIISMLPIAIIDRPFMHTSALSSPMAHVYRSFRLDERESIRLPFMKPPAWTYLHGPLSFQSSTNLRLKENDFS
ncbi:nicotinate-nucleotide adenylyltransferase [Bartonella taylorii]|uniref:Probable nicotinate-nucleotide adenylyltransferase n=2 Tax=Bartonella taylorii TaxID=33046 RepID=A0A9Q8YZ43_BARTA|nr:nicotinate-nucleotide adenylyltransferase [Bartonella taylorii]EJF96301.1 nicotinate (nicotinamide) nucleotide adenylyltransferase [Bartonella taylorii 8TBB]OPB35647.1 nicotinate-nucleotide adenylyltransferase [Bartonella taylorii]USP02095.1 nicotinate-nucleotide adenylyltransferase [Bartonella taylorii]USP03678.1 nicotinate-nucleotide adenylyltransferase [Bartonella taylorii]